MSYVKRYESFKNIRDYASKKNYLIELYKDYLLENRLYENTSDASDVSKNEIDQAEKLAKKEDYTGLAKIFKSILTKNKKIGLAIVLIANLLHGNVDSTKLVNSLESQGIDKAIINKVEIEIDKNNDFYKKGVQLTKQTKERDQNQPQYSKTPCYQYTFNFMKLLNPNLDNAILKDMKMTYKKDINNLTAKESQELSINSLSDNSELVTLNDLNNKWNLGTEITKPEEVKVGDIINFWVYDLIEFLPAEENYSYPNTKEDFEKYQQNNPVNINDWRIEEAKLIWGHYAVVSAIDNDWIYLSSSGEKGGPNGIWNGVDKSDTEELLTKIRKSDMNFNKLKYDDIKFKRTDDISGKRARIPLRIEIIRLNLSI